MTRSTSKTGRCELFERLTATHRCTGGAAGCCGPAPQRSAVRGASLTGSAGTSAPPPRRSRRRTIEVRAQEAGVGDGLAGRAEVGLLAGDRDGADPHRHRRADRVGHLRRDRAPPDQLVEPVLLGGQLVRDLARRPERVAGRPDRLVRLLRVLTCRCGGAAAGRCGGRGRRSACGPPSSRSPQVHGVRTPLGDVPFS